MSRLITSIAPAYRRKHTSAELWCVPECASECDPIRWCRSDLTMQIWRDSESDPTYDLAYEPHQAHFFFFWTCSIWFWCKCQMLEHPFSARRHTETMPMLVYAWLATEHNSPNIKLEKTSKINLGLSANINQFCVSSRNRKKPVIYVPNQTAIIKQLFYC